MPSNASNTDFSEVCSLNHERPRRLTLKWCVRIWIRIHQIFLVTVLTDTDGIVRPVPLPVPVSKLKYSDIFSVNLDLSSLIPEDESNMFHHNVRINHHHCMLSGSRKLQSCYEGLFVLLVAQFHPWIQYVAMFLVTDVAVYRWIHLSVEFPRGSTHDRNSDCFKPMLKHLGL